MPGDIILSLSCPDRPGIVATVGTRLFDAGCNVLEAHQYNDPETQLFFMRVRFTISLTTHHCLSLTVSMSICSTTKS